MTYPAFNPLKPDPSVDNGSDAFTGTRTNLLALRDAALAGSLPGWDLSVSGGTAERPTTWTYSKSTERLRLTITWGTTGGPNGKPQTVVSEYSSNSGTDYDAIGTSTLSYDSSGNFTASAGLSPGLAAYWLMGLPAKVAAVDAGLAAHIASLGTAAYAALTTSTQDDTAGRAVRIGDWGFGGGAITVPAADTEDLPRLNGVSFAGDNLDNAPLNTTAWVLIDVSARDDDNAVLLATILSGANVGRRFLRCIIAGAWESDWREIPAGNLKTVNGASLIGSGDIDTVTETEDSASGTSFTAAITGGTIKRWTVSGTATVTDSLSNGQSLSLFVTNTSSHSVTWPTITWRTSNGNAPDWQTSGATVIVVSKVGGTLYGWSANG